MEKPLAQMSIPQTQLGKYDFIFQEVSSNQFLSNVGMGCSFRQDALHGRLVDIHSIESKASHQGGK